MAYIDWSHSYSVGIESLDRQHEQLVKMLNEMYSAMQSGQGQASLGRVLNNLAHYCISHFAAEERLMREHGYPDYAAHKAIHDKMTAKVKSLLQEVNSGQTPTSMSVAGFLKDWLTKHIQQTDMKYGPFLRSQGVD